MIERGVDAILLAVARKGLRLNDHQRHALDLLSEIARGDITFQGFLENASYVDYCPTITVKLHGSPQARQAGCDCPRAPIMDVEIDTDGRIGRPW